MSGPTFIPVKAALKTLWSATFAAADVVVEYGPRAPLALTTARLRIGRVRGQSDPEALGPTRPMLEVYDVECILSATINGTVNDQQSLTEKVAAWYEVAEYAIRSSPTQTLGVAGVRWVCVMGDFELIEHPASETGGTISTSLSFNVHVEAMYRLS